MKKIIIKYDIEGIEFSYIAMLGKNSKCTVYIQPDTQQYAKIINYVTLPYC